MACTWFVLLLSLSPSLSVSALSLYLSRSLVLSLWFFRWHFSGHFVFFVSEILVLPCCIFYVKMKLFLRPKWTESELRCRKGTERQREREGKKLRKVDSANAANGSRNAASQIDRQIWRSSRSSCVEGLQEWNKIQIVPVKERNKRKECKQDTNVQK